MPESKSEAWFHIDFGMTGCAGEGMKIPSQNSLSSIQSCFISKTPTTILYDEEGNVKVGKRASDECGMVSNLKGLFVDKISAMIRPSEMKTAEELITDYLHQFCSDLLYRFLKKEGIVKHQLKAMWYLTTPGCWSKGDQLDFQGLAQKVLVSILPDSTVCVDISESLASCEFLVDHLQLSPGTWAITCDVGGLTVDTAICLTQSVEGKTIPEAFPIAFKAPIHRGGLKSVADIDRDLYLLLEQAVSHEDTARSDARDKALNFVYSSQWEAFRHEFQGETDLNITLESSLNIKNHNVGGNSISIKGKLITVSRHLIQALFNDFLRRMYDELDNAIRRFKEVSNGRRRPDLIALCGGGGMMAELLNKLKLRYPGIPIKTAQTIEQSCLATIHGHRIYRLRQILQSFLASVHLGISAPEKGSLKRIEWRENPTRETIFQFIATGSSKTQVHYFLVHLKGNMRPEQFATGRVTKEPGEGDRALVWRLEVPVVRPRLGKQVYFITVECTGSGRGAFSFKAHDGQSPAVNLNLVAAPYYCLD